MRKYQKLSAEQLSCLENVTVRMVEQNLAHVLEVKDFGHPHCCDVPIYRTIGSDGWDRTMFCEHCLKITTNYDQDGGSGIYVTPCDIWETPTESNPFIDFSQVHELAEYMSSVIKDKGFAPWWGPINDYKAWKRKQVKG